MTLSIGSLTGCSDNFGPSPVEPEQVPIGNIQGAVHGGQAPISGAQIYLFAAGTGGYGTNATSLITSGKPGVSCNGSTGNSNPALNNACYVTTDINGDFALGGDYTCTVGQQVYMVAIGGNPGQTGTVNNTSIVQMVGLAQCPAAGNLAAQVPWLVINEVTTVAFAYAMGGFATTAFNVSTDASGAAAIANAMANANNIVSFQNGLALSIASGNPKSISPQSRIYALANILSTCVNTASATSGQCNSLFNAATTSSGTKATDEANAIFNIVHNQAHNVASIWALNPTTPIFTPTLSSQPTDWTMPVIYKNVISLPSAGSPITSGPYEMAFDASGNAWIGDRANGVVEIGPQGLVTAFTNSAKGFGMVKGVAVSPQDGSIWVSDYGKSDVYVMDSTGTKLATITQHLTSNGPVLTAFALNPGGGNYLAYEVTETSTGITAFDSGTYVVDYNADNSVYPNVSSPGWIVADNTGAVWFPSTKTTYIGGLGVSYKNGAMGYVVSEPNVGATYQTIAEAEGAAADSLGKVWAPSGAGLYEVTAGAVTGAFTGGGMNNPSKTFVDGSNVVWVANAGANTVSAFYTTPNTIAGNPLATNGFGTDAAGGTGCSVIGVDPSGDVWVGNTDLSVTQLLGLATPTAAPLYAGQTVITGTGGGTVTTVTKGNLGTKP